ncbi:MAG: hypothetical protein NVSMB27_47980 [Ktedonobacteraceae bacterium]
MLYILASDPLAAWGQTAAIVLLVYMLVSILIGVVLAFVLLLGLTWVRGKVELIKKLRPTVDSVNTTTEKAIKGTLPAARADDNKIVRVVAEIPVQAHSIEQRVEQGSDRVAAAVIEFRARTMMAKGIVKAFFLPGLTHRTQTALEKEGVGFRSPGFRMLMGEKAPVDAPTGPGEGYTGNITASQLKDAPVEVVASPPKELQSVTSEVKNAPAP